jgi:hypothetical protein
MVDSAPEIAELAVDLHERLIQMPPPLRIPAHVRHPPFSDLSGKHRAESVPPKPDRLMADVDPALWARRAVDEGVRSSDSGYFTYINTARGIISGELLK